MQILDRIALIVRPKRRYVEWANGLMAEGPGLTLEQVRSQPFIYLVVPEDEEIDVKEVIDQRAGQIFDDQLRAWHDDEAAWPRNRTLHLFRDWFDIEISELVEDLDDEEPLVDVTEYPAEVAMARCGWCARELADGESPIAVPAEVPSAEGIGIGEDVAHSWHVPSEAGYALMTRGDEEPPAAAGHLAVTFWVCSDACATALRDGLAAQAAEDAEADRLDADEAESR